LKEFALPVLAESVSQTAPVFDGRTVILDTDVLYDPDDIVNLVIAARTVKDLVVITADEVDGWRARGALALLASLGRSDVPVIEGLGLDSDRLALDPEIMETFPEAPKIHILEAIPDICDAVTDPVLWVGCGPMTNLANLFETFPHLAEKLDVVQMGGWLDPARYRNPDRASHNFHTDIRAAGVTLRMCHHLKLMLSEHTGVPETRITPDSPLYQRLAAPDAPAWAGLVAANFDAWFKRRPGSWLHDPLTLAAALGEPFVSFAPERIQIAADTRLYRHPDGRDIEISVAVDYPAFMTWLSTMMQ
jgi:inosine-uridine nucleoside N-ribohydrolase